MSSHLTPLNVCLALVGPLPVISAVCGKHEKSAYGWRHASQIRDAGDIPGTREQRALLRHAAKHDLGLVAEHLIFGASELQVRAILAARGFDDAEIDKRLRPICGPQRQVAAE